MRNTGIVVSVHMLLLLLTAWAALNSFDTESCSKTTQSSISWWSCKQPSTLSNIIVIRDKTSHQHSVKFAIFTANKKLQQSNYEKVTITEKKTLNMIKLKCYIKYLAHKTYQSIPAASETHQHHNMLLSLILLPPSTTATYY